MKDTILVTGDKGMIGSLLVKGLISCGHMVVGIDKAMESPNIGFGNQEFQGEKYYSYKCNLDDSEQLLTIFEKHKIDRIIHLAALAHTENEEGLSWKKYYHENVTCAKNIFKLAGNRPVLFISTVDVYGFTDGSSVNKMTPLKPVTYYAKSKKMAEEECTKLPDYTIFRFAPVYKEDNKRDIQKRYYLKYPRVAYQIGNGIHYEVLNIDKAVDTMISWCLSKEDNGIYNIKDDELMWTPDCIEEEKKEGRANLVLKIPRWMANLIYKALKLITGENRYTYLLNKAVCPIRSEE